MRRRDGDWGTSLQLECKRGLRGVSDGFWRIRKICKNEVQHCIGVSTGRGKFSMWKIDLSLKTWNCMSLSRLNCVQIRHRSVNSGSEALCSSNKVHSHVPTSEKQR